MGIARAMASKMLAVPQEAAPQDSRYTGGTASILLDQNIDLGRVQLL